MEAAGGGRTPEFLSTHPNPETRRAQLREWLPEARRYYENRSLPLPLR
jgi:predicted Zn-dependent protease